MVIKPILLCKNNLFIIFSTCRTDSGESSQPIYLQTGHYGNSVFCLTGSLEAKQDKALRRGQMGERMKKGEFIRITKEIVELFYRSSDFYQSKYYTEKTICIISDINLEDRRRYSGERKGTDRKTVGRILHREYAVVVETEETAVVVGKYCILYKGSIGETKDTLYNVSLTLRCMKDGVKAEVLHISRESKQHIHKLRDVQKREYLIEEGCVLYLEAGHNRVRWHCKNGIVETVNTLKEIEQGLSGCFVRIHRGFIVNRQHISKVCRCYVELDNGEMLQIPVKKYVSVKERLFAGDGMKEQSERQKSG